MKFLKMALAALLGSALLAGPLAAAEYQSFAAADGTRIDYAVVLPQDYRPGESYPVMLAFPPGPQTKAMVEAGVEPFATQFRHSLESMRWLVHSVIDPEWGKPGPITKGIRSLLDTPSHRDWRLLAGWDSLGNQLLPKSVVVYGRKLERADR